MEADPDQLRYEAAAATHSQRIVENWDDRAAFIGAQRGRPASAMGGPRSKSAAGGGSPAAGRPPSAPPGEGGWEGGTASSDSAAYFEHHRSIEHFEGEPGFAQPEPAQQPARRQPTSRSRRRPRSAAAGGVAGEEQPAQGSGSRSRRRGVDGPAQPLPSSLPLHERVQHRRAHDAKHAAAVERVVRVKHDKALRIAQSAAKREGLHRNVRRRDCHFTDIPTPSLLKHLLKGEGSAAA